MSSSLPPASDVSVGSTFPMPDYAAADLMTLCTVNEALRDLLVSPENQAYLLVCRHGDGGRLVGVLAKACMSVVLGETQQQQRHRMRVVEHLLRLLHGRSVVEAWGALDLARLHVMSCTDAISHHLHDVYGYGERVAGKTRDAGPSCARTAFQVALHGCERGFGSREAPLAWLAFLRRHFPCCERVSSEFVNCRDGKGRTPLMCAIVARMPDIALCVLEVPGVRVNTHDNDGRTPLMHAIDEGMPGVALRILKVPHAAHQRVTHETAGHPQRVPRSQINRM